MKKFLFIFLISFPLISYADLFGSSNYEDCVLKGIKDAKTDSAVGTLNRMCRKKFPGETNKIPGVCLLYWDGLHAVRLNSEPKNWRANYSKFSIAKYGSELAHVFTQKSFLSTPESEAEIYHQVQYSCN